MIYILVFFIASLASTVSGFFGSGSGLISVPLLSRILYLTDIPPQYNMHVVIGTLFPFGLIISIFATYARHKQNHIDWNILRRLLFPTIFGVISGSLFTHSLSNHYLRIFFGLFILIVAIRNLLGMKYTKTNFWQVSGFHFEIMAFFAGFISGVTSVGILMIINLKKYGLPLLSSIAVAQAIGIVTAVVGTIMYLILGLGVKSLPGSCFGYIEWQLLIPMTLGGILCTKLGTNLSYRVSEKVLNKLFCGFLFIVASEMLLGK